MPAPDPLLADLTDAQREAVLHEEGPLLVVAGPGSGKTRVITRRVARLVSRGVPPSAILAITFTNKAAAEMARRVSELCDAEGAWVRTFHSTCAAILRRFPRAAGLEHGFSIYDDGDQRKVLREALKRRNVPRATLNASGARSRISRWKCEGTTPEEALARAYYADEKAAAEAFEDYERALAASNAVDFDDLLLRTVDALERDEAVRRIISAQFAYVLIDEYQDTSPLQFRLSARFAERTGNICATGDPDQSIYAFRNADLRNILEFESHYPGAQVVRLERNFRSVKNVLVAADALITNNRDRRSKRLLTDREDGPPIRVASAWTEREEGLMIADAILAAYARGVPYSDMALFYRVNAQSRALEAGLRSRGVPYQIVKGTEFYQRAEVKDLLAYLKVIANPRDRESMDRVLTTPRKGIGAKSIQAIRALADEEGVDARTAVAIAADRGIVSKRAAGAVRALDAVLQELARGADGPVGPLLDDVVRRVRYEKFLEDTYDEEAEDRIANVRELIGGAREYDAQAGGDASLVGFLLHVGLVSDIDRLDDSLSHVPLMTLHTAKGLEFEEVFIAGLEEGLLPHSRSTDDRAALEEERRLLFVGITRAKRRLTLSYALHRQARIVLGGGPSRFLTELPEEVLDVERTTGPAAVPQSQGGTWRSSSSSAPARAPGSSRPGPAPAEEFHGVDAVDPAAYAGIDEPVGPRLEVGQWVVHPKFGRGRLTHLSGHGPGARAVVDFVGAGRRTLALAHARLTPA